MTDILEYDYKEFFEREACKILRECFGDYMPRYPKLNKIPIGLYEAEDISGQQMLFEFRGLYFLAFYLGMKTDKCNIAVGRKNDGTDWKYWNRLSDTPRFLIGESLAPKTTYFGKDDLISFLEGLPVNSFLRITDNARNEVLGLYLSVTPSKVNLAFGYDSDRDCYEKITNTSLYRRRRDRKFVESSDSNSKQNIINFATRDILIEREILLANCHKIELLAMRDGTSDLNLLMDYDKKDDILNKLFQESFELLYTGKSKLLKFSFDGAELSVVSKNNFAGNDIQKLPGFLAAPCISELKTKAGLNQSEDEEPQSGFFYYPDDSGKRIQIIIEYHDLVMFEIVLTAQI